MVKALIIGGGPAGCIATDMLTRKGWDVTLVESHSELGGSCRTFWWGGHPYTLGPRHFLTKREDVWNYLDAACPLRRYEGHEFLTYVERDQAFYHFPIHRDEVELMPDSQKIREELAVCSGAEGAHNLEEYWLMSVGPTLYEKFVNSYSRKMWGIDSNTEITDFGFTPKGVALKTGPIKAAWSEAMSGFPLAADGYNSWFDKTVQNATVKLNTHCEDYDIENHRVKIAGEWHRYDIIVSTVSPEVILKDAFGALRWAGRDFLKIVLPVEHCLPPEIYFLYYANTEPFTRIVEYKKFYHYDSPTTLLGIEVPSTRNKLYPYPMKADQERHQKYIDALPKNVFSIGRSGSYRYLDIGMIIEQCMDLFKDV